MEDCFWRGTTGHNRVERSLRLPQSEATALGESFGSLPKKKRKKKTGPAEQVEREDPAPLQAIKTITAAWKE